MSRSGILFTAYCGVFASFASVFIFSFSVLVKPLSTEFGWTRTQLSGGFALAALTVAFASPPIGRLVDRFGSRAVILPSATIFASAFASLYWLTPNLVHFYALMFLMGAVGNGTSQLAFSRAVVEAFDSRRGLALAVMLAGTGTGSMLVPLLAQAGIDALGWRTTALCFGAAIFLLAVPLTALWIPGASARDPSRVRKGLPRALRSSLFWAFLASFFLMSLAVNAALAHLAPLLSDRGLTPQMAALGASVMGAATLGGRLATGWMLDRWPAARVASLLFAGAAAGLASLALGADSTTAFLSAALIGLGMGAEADVIPYLLSRHFELESFAELYGYSFSAFALAGALGPILMGHAFDSFGSYDSVLALMAVAAFTAALLISRAASAPLLQKSQAEIVESN